MQASGSHGLFPTALARIFVMKIGVLPERVLVPLLNDRMVAKGTILAFVTDFFVDFLATGSVDDLVSRVASWRTAGGRQASDVSLRSDQGLLGRRPVGRMRVLRLRGDHGFIILMAGSAAFMTNCSLDLGKQFWALHVRWRC